MFVDARTLPENTRLETDVCIVGAGAAGITLARELIGQPFRVCLLESGGLQYEEETQALYEGRNIGQPYSPLNGTRLRFFGGSTNHWTGLCRPLDETDFTARDWIPHSGWPFPKSHLLPYYERAQAICQLGPLAYDIDAWDTANTLRFPSTDDRVVTSVFQISPPTRFGDVYRNEISDASNIQTYLHANVVDIETNDTAQTVTRLRVACLEGNKIWVSAKLFILATGGIENPRLLLASNTVRRTGLGNDYDLVGRYFMEHLHVLSGVLLPAHPSAALDFHFQPRLINDVSVQGLVALSPDTLRRERLTGFSAALVPASEEETSKGFRSALALGRSLRRGHLPSDVMTHLKNVITDVSGAAHAAYDRTASTPGGPGAIFRFANRSEQTPNPESRVVLDQTRDRLGSIPAALDWRLAAIDKDSVKRAHEIIAAAVGAAGIGRVRVTFDDDATFLAGGAHHMGTTRMHVDPKQGVVNADCLVHGMSNLLIAGSSVFPNVGYANPTLTIVALAVRLADHVKGLMR